MEKQSPAPNQHKIYVGQLGQFRDALQPNSALIFVS